MKIDRGQLQFREYVSTGTEPYGPQVTEIQKNLIDTLSEIDTSF